MAGVMSGCRLRDMVGLGTWDRLGPWFRHVKSVLGSSCTVLHMQKNKKQTNNICSRINRTTASRGVHTAVTSVHAAGRRAAPRRACAEKVDYARLNVDAQGRSCLIYVILLVIIKG